MTTKENIISILNSTLDFVSGEELAQTCNVSRAAVHKAITSLRSNGYKIEAVTNKGYKLDCKPDKVDGIQIEKIIKTQGEDCTVYAFEEIDSTNLEAKRKTADSELNRVLFVAGRQTAGRGRMGRTFASPANSGIYFSLVYRPKGGVKNPAFLTAAAAIAVKNAVKKLYNEDCQIKWVNDVFLNGKKICGILTEGVTNFETGDCYLLSAIAAIVKNNPDDITSMMEDFGSLVKVTFGDQSVYVSKKICSYGSAKNVLWVQIMEKAFAKAFGKKFSNSETWQKYMEYVQFVDKNRLNGDDPTKFLKEAYWSTTKVIGGGGHSHEALNSLLGLKHSKAIYSEIVTADSRSSAYSNVWKLAKNIRDKEKAIKPELKEFLIDYLKDRLWKELQSRQRLAIKEATKARRAITIDDLKDILLDIKNWKNQNGLSVYNMLFLQARLKFSDITEEEMLKHINHLANKFMEVGQLQPYDDNNLQYKANLNSNNALYTPTAKETFKTIKEAVDKKLEIGVGSERFAQYEKGAVEKDANYNAGIVMAHAYTIVDCFEENGHSYITLRNTWGSGRLNYIKKTGADGKEKIIAGIKQTKDKNHGTFNIELNDFMNSFSKIYVVDAHERSQKKLIKVKQQEEKEKAKKAEEQKKAEKLKKLGEILNASESLDEAYSTIPKLDYESSTSLSTKDSKLKFLMDFDRQISEKVEDKDLGEWVILMRSDLEKIKGYSKNEFLTLNYWCRLLAKRQPKLLKLLLEKMIIEDILQYEEAKDDYFDKYRDRLQFLDAIMDKFKPDLSLFKDRQNMVSVFADDAKEYLESKKDKRGRLSAKSIYEAFEKFDTSDIKDSDKIAFEDDTEKVNLGSADLNEMVKSPYWKVYVKSMDPQFLVLLRKRNFLHQQSLKMVKSIRNKDKTYNQDNYGQFQKLRTQRELCDYCIGLLKKEILINFNWRMKLDSEESADKLK